MERLPSRAVRRPPLAAVLLAAVLAAAPTLIGAAPDTPITRALTFLASHQVREPLDVVIDGARVRDDPGDWPQYFHLRGAEWLRVRDVSPFTVAFIHHALALVTEDNRVALNVERADVGVARTMRQRGVSFLRGFGAPPEAPDAGTFAFWPYDTDPATPDLFTTFLLTLFFQGPILGGARVPLNLPIFPSTLAIPSDADVTATTYASLLDDAVLDGGSGGVADAARVFVDWRDLDAVPRRTNPWWLPPGSGTFLTWLTYRTQPWPVFPNDVDLVVNANVLYALGRYGRLHVPGVREAVDTINLVTGLGLHFQGLDGISEYYPDNLVFQYAVSRAYQEGRVAGLRPAVDVFLQDLEAAAITGADGSVHWDQGAPHLNTAFAVLTLLNAGRHSWLVDPAVEYLRAQQDDDGGFGEATFFFGRTDGGQVFEFSSAAFTTAMALEAFARDRLVHCGRGPARRPFAPRTRVAEPALSRFARYGARSRSERPEPDTARLGRAEPDAARLVYDGNDEGDMDASSNGHAARESRTEGRLIVITAPLTETIDHAGYFIQMSMASLPIWLEGILNKKYPKWRDVEYNADGTARYMPAGVRVLEASLLRRFKEEDVVCCYPAALPRFVGPRTRLVAVSTHNPLGVTFAAGVYASIFGSAKVPINSYYARELFAAVKGHPNRSTFQVVVGGSGGWQITQTDSYQALGVDCVVQGRSESEDLLALFERAIAGETLPRTVDVSHPTDRDAILFPDKRTTFGVVEMTTGCGRRCQFCVPDLNPQIDLPKDKIMAAVRANVREGNKQISLATEDMFIWGQVHTNTPFYFPNREALVDLFSEVVDTPGVEQHVLSHSTIAPAVVDPVMIKQLSDKLLDKSPIHLPLLSSHPKRKALVPLIGLETGSVPVAKRVMPSKGVPFPIEEWPSVIVRGLEILNRHNWFPAMTLIIGAPGETDEDVKATIDLIYEVERRGLFAFFIPSIFTPLHDTRMAKAEGVTETKQLSPFEWQLMMKCWKMNLRPGQNSWWAPTVWRLGALGLWAWRLRRMNGPGFTWPLFMFASALPESLMGAMGRIHVGRPLAIKTRRELLATIKPQMRKFLREDAGDLPDDWTPAPPSSPKRVISLTPAPGGA